MMYTTSSENEFENYADNAEVMLTIAESNKEGLTARKLLLFTQNELSRDSELKLRIPALT